jgi:putative aldouronate transport system substrate-binding protein
MYMKRNPLICICLLVALLLSLLAGCGNSAQTTTSTESAQPAASETVQESAAAEDSAATQEAAPAAETSAAPETEPEAAPEAAEEAPAENVLQPSSVVINYPLETTESLTYWLPWIPLLSQYYDTYNDHPAYAYADTATGVHVEYTSCSQDSATTEFALMVASGDMRDIVSNVNYYNGGAAAAIEDEVFLDLTDLLPDYMPDYYNALIQNEHWLKYVTTDEGYIGGIYGFNQTELGLNSGYFIRQDWLDALGLDTPSTLSEWETVLTAFRDNYDITDPLLMSANLTSPLSYALGSGNFDISDASNLAFYVEDGQVVCCFNSEAYGDYIGLLADWYQKGLIGVDFFSRSTNNQDSEITAAILDGQVGIWQTVMSNRDDYPVRAADPNFANTPIGDPLPDDGSLLTFYSDDPSAGSSCAISYDCANWELALNWCNYWFTDAGLLNANYGVEGVSYNLVDGEPVYTDVIYNNPDGLIFQVARVMYCVNGCVSFGDPTIVRDFVYSDDVIACTAVWEASYGSSESSISSSVNMTTSESTQFYGIYTDSGTYAQTELLRFVVGERPMSEWSDFMQTCETMGINTCTEIYQQAYDRYLAR